MSQVRLVGVGRVHHYRAAVAAMRKVAAIASGIEGVAVWESFADEVSGLVYLNEAFASEDALMAYEAAVDQAGLRPEVASAMQLERLLILSPIENPRLTEQLASIGAIRAELVASK